MAVMSCARHGWQSALDPFWRWYRRHYLATLVFTTIVFSLQVLHLYWLLSDVVVVRLFGQSPFYLPPVPPVAYALVDLLEVPALLSASSLYLFELRSRITPRSLLMLALLNTQWLHMFWLTDEVVVATLTHQNLVAWNAAVAWVAILIDYLEVPVMVDSARKVYRERAAIWRLLRANGVLGRTASSWSG
jgi:hypothetical protein